VGIKMNLTRAKAIKGWMSNSELEWLATQAEKCKIIIEFGSYLGRSTRALADNSPADCKIYAVDPWNGKYFREDDAPIKLFSIDDYGIFFHNLEDHIRNGKVIPYLDYSENFPESLNHSDLTFIDGDHRSASVVKDIQKAIIITKDGGIICGHDYGQSDWPGVKMAVDSMFTPSEVKLHDTIWWITL
jgi:predicted O-methyltransferase YrrM